MTATTQKETPAGSTGDPERNIHNGSQSQDSGTPAPRLSAHLSADNPRYGATPEEWRHFSETLGLTADLLPVVSNPHAEKSPDSKIQGPGKTPSDYNRKGQMRGFANWTSHHATPEEITKWSAEPDYAIGLQAREVRAIDVDIEDFDESVDVEDYINSFLSVKLPIRRRKNSCKFLMAFRLAGDFKKRRFPTKTEKGAIEFLATGQQFVAIGTHPSGAKYEWVGGLPTDIPTLTEDEFNALRKELEKRFASAPSMEQRTSGKALVKPRSAADIDDPTVDFLYEKWEVFSQSSDGKIFFRCPNESEHTTDSGETATAYFPAGVGGHAQGHFVCLHSHCQHLTDHDFKAKIGYLDRDMPVIECDEPTDMATIEREDAARRSLYLVEQSPNKKAKATLRNLEIALAHPEASGWRFAFDRFTAQTLAARLPPETWEPMTDTTFVRLRTSLTQSLFNFEEIGRDLARDAVSVAADDNTIDSAQDWLTCKKWDEVERVARFLCDYFGAEDTPYHRAVSLYLWTALAGRVMEPGIKADMVPIAVGTQGLRKSSGVEAIAPLPSSFWLADLKKSDDDLGRHLAGKVIAELGELAGLRKRAIEEVKRLITASSDEWIPKFKEASYRQPRRCVFFGTTNEEKPLPHDDSGQRRWLPFNVTRMVDVDAIVRDRDQLWAEGAVIFRQHGIQWEEAETAAKELHAKFVTEDVWLEIVKEYFSAPGEMNLDKCWEKENVFTAVDLLHEAIGIPTRQISDEDKKRMAKIIQRIAVDFCIEKKKTNSKRGYVRKKEDAK